MTFKKDMWFAYVINHVIENCKSLCILQCKGCQLKWKSVILHQHEHLSLLEKIEKHLVSAREDLLGVKLRGLLKHFEQSETLSMAGKKELLNQTRTLILYATPQSLYYGRWMTVEHELIFRDMFIKRRRKTRDIKKAKANEVQPNELQSSSRCKKHKRLHLDNAPVIPYLQNIASEQASNTCKIPSNIEENTPRNSPPDVESIEQLLWKELQELSSDDE